MTAITLQRTSVVLDATTIVQGIDLDIAHREWLGLIGPNGAGKTTLLRAIAGLVPHHGYLTVDGTDPRTLTRRAVARRVAMVPQQPVVPAGLTVTDYVLLGRTPFISYLGVESRRDRRIVADLLNRLDLTRLADRPLGSLSGGEFQRAVLARALAQQAPVLLLDEPTTALDIGHAQQVMELVDQLRREDGLTVVSAMHDLTVAAQYADRLLLLVEGKAIACGPPGAVLTEASISEHYSGACVQVLELADGGVVVAPTRPLRHRSQQNLDVWSSTG